MAKNVADNLAQGLFGDMLGRRTRVAAGSPVTYITALTGTLDILSAFVYAARDGHGPLPVLQGIGSAIWPAARHAGIAGAAVGLLLHFAIMFAMVAAFTAASKRVALLRGNPFVVGALYGILLWAIMNLIVLPLRWPSVFPHFVPVELGEQIFSHVALVGIPVAWFARRRGTGV